MIFPAELAPREPLRGKYAEGKHRCRELHGSMCTNVVQQKFRQGTWINKMYFFDGRIRYSETDSEGYLTMGSLLNYFQDCSTFQSEDLGMGVAALREQRRVWVLSSWQIVVERYPKFCEQVRIGTLPYEFKGFIGCRNFAMMTADGEYLAKANSLWSLLDTQTGKPAIPSEEMRNKYRVEPRLEMEYAPRKIVIPTGGCGMEPVTVKRHHLDTNHHVNNGKYIEVASEYLPENFAIRQLRAEYKKQAFLDDIFYPYVMRTEETCVVALNDESGKPYVVVEFS